MNTTNDNLIATKLEEVISSLCKCGFQPLRYVHGNPPQGQLLIFTEFGLELVFVEWDYEYDEFHDINRYYPLFFASVNHDELPDSTLTRLEAPDIAMCIDRIPQLDYNWVAAMKDLHDFMELAYSEEEL